MTEFPAPCPHLWAMGGGKGGVGRSVVAALVALVLARTGRRVVLVDADLGGANLHTLLGVVRPRRTLADFLDRRVDSLAESAVPTGVDSLALVSGVRPSLEVANLGHADKVRLLRELGSLDADHVVVDVGAGATFNVLDLFLCAHTEVVVLVAEATAVERAHHFLKAALLRKLGRAGSGARLLAALSAVTGSAERLDLRSLRDLVPRVMLEDREAGAALLTEVGSFTPSLVVNRCETGVHRRLGPAMATVCSDFFGSRVECLAALPRDPSLPRWVGERRSLDELPQENPLVSAVGSLVERATVPGEARRA